MFLLTLWGKEFELYKLTGGKVQWHAECHVWLNDKWMNQGFGFSDWHFFLLRTMTVHKSGDDDGRDDVSDTILSWGESITNLSPCITTFNNLLSATWRLEWAFCGLGPSLPYAMYL